MLGISYENSQLMYQTFVEKEFNKYAEENHLNITLKIDIKKNLRQKDSWEYLKIQVGSAVQKTKMKYSENKFEMFFYDNRFTNLFGPYLMNLNYVFTEGDLDYYDPKIIEETCIYDEQLVGIPMGVSYNALYSNNLLLNKYNKSAPRTWDELINTCKYIMKKENNTDLICYNGLFEDSDQGLNSLYEFIYSNRDSYDSNYPNSEDQAFKDSLITLKKVKDEIASDKIFANNDVYAYDKLMDGNFIFLKYEILDKSLYNSTIYRVSTIPGGKRVLSGSMIGGDNIGIFKDLDEEKREATYEVLYFLTSKEFKKKLFENEISLTPVTELMDDKEICKTMPCDLLKKIQFTSEPSFLKDGPNDFRKKYKKYIFDYLYNNKTLEETVKDVVNIDKVYYISMSTKDSNVGFLFFLCFALVTLLMVLSLAFLFMKQFKGAFKYLPTDFWIISVIGSIIISCVPFVSYGRVSPMKCYFKILLISLGYTISVTPSLYKLIGQHPGRNKISTWVNENRYMFFISNILIDLLLNSISLASPYASNLVLINGGGSFETCRFDSINLIVVFVYKFIVIFLFLYLIFIEWNISNTLYDVRFTVTAIYCDILTFILVYVFNFFEFKRYEYNFSIQTVIISLIAVSNYIFLYAVRILFKIIRKGDSYFELNEKTEVQPKSINDNDSDSKSEKRRSNFVSKMMDYHSRESAIIDNNNPTIISSIIEINDK